MRKSLKRIYPSIRFVGKTESLARSFYEADLALITGGVAAYEAAATGTPALYFFFNREQEFMADSFVRKGAGIKMSPITGPDKDKIPGVIRSINFENAVSMGRAGKKIVDGKGVNRIIDFLKNQHIISI